jgi:hypothetical protein
LVTKQVGVKEIRNGPWEFYNNIFKNYIKYVLIGRHPKDIYISCHYQLKRSDHWTPRIKPFNPAGLYGELSYDIEAMFCMSEKKDSFKVKYEELCDNEGILENIKEFVKSPIKKNGSVGAFHTRLKRGDYENSVHDFKITKKAVYRYKFEQDKKLLKDAEAFYTLMSDYNNFWGY